MTDDFCVVHGRDYMKTDKEWGSIPYCTKCRRRHKTYDHRCYDLAEVFLDDGVHTTIEIAEKHKKRCEELAAHIQSAIEDWIEMNQ